jgi:hypothetical protein
MPFSGIIDLGDVEASYLDTNHPLRAGQNPKKESTMDAIIRNAVDYGELTPLGKKVVEEDLRSINEMATHDELYGDTFFRCIQGNALEVKSKIFDAIAPDKKDDLFAAFAKYDWVMKEADAEVIGDTGLVYLPWKCSVESVRSAFEKVGDVKKIGLFSHDYLLGQSIPKKYRSGMRSNNNVEQIVLSLDLASERTKLVEGFFGHIGFEYPVFKQSFQHNKTTVDAYHVDEKDQSLLYFDVNGINHTENLPARL